MIKNNLLPRERMTPEEFEIFMKMLDYEEKYFADMMFKTRELESYLRIKMQGEDGNWHDVQEDLPGWKNVDLSLWTIRLKKRMGIAAGRCLGKKKIIEIKKTNDNNSLKYTLIHEMIHAYEEMLFDRYRQLLCFYFKKKLFAQGLTERKFKKLLELDEFLARANSHTVFHSVLFMLKALSLDRRLRVSEGTIHGYGREEHYKKKGEDE